MESWTPARNRESSRSPPPTPRFLDRLDLLVQHVDLYLNDGPSDDLDPPSGLLEASFARVDEVRGRWSIREFVPVRVPFRWADVAVAASILLAGVLTLLPSVHRSRIKMDQAECGFNLQQLGVGLAQYTTANHSLPLAEPDGPAPYAGVWAMLLKDSGHLPNLQALDCPANGKHEHAHHLPELSSFENEQHAAARRMLCGDYAFNLCFCVEPGAVEGRSDQLNALIPLMADLPPHSDDLHKILEGNSPNHYGRGQNVLFVDGHVVWLPSRSVPSIKDNDLFTNAQGVPAPGPHLFDASLVPGCFRIDGAAR